MTAALCAARRCERDPVLGLLCSMDGQRLADHYGAREGHGQPGRPIHGLPWMWDHVQLAYPSLTGWAGTGGKSDIDDAEAQKLVAVLELRQDIHDHLTITARELAEDIGRIGPDTATTARLRVQRSARWLLAHIEPLRAGQGARATPEAIEGAIVWAETEPVSDVGEAIQAAHDRVAVERVACLLEAADDLASRCHSLAPWREAPTRIDGIPCRCGAVGTVHDFGEIKKCIRCGKSYVDVEWASLMKVLAYRFGEQSA